MESQDVSRLDRSLVETVLMRPLTDSLGYEELPHARLHAAILAQAVSDLGAENRDRRESAYHYLFGEEVPPSAKLLGINLDHLRQLARGYAKAVHQLFPDRRATLEACPLFRRIAA